MSLGYTCMLWYLDTVIPVSLSTCKKYFNELTKGSVQDIGTFYIVLVAQRVPNYIADHNYYLSFVFILTRTDHF